MGHVISLIQEDLSYGRLISSASSHFLLPPLIREDAMIYICKEGNTRKLRSLLAFYELSPDICCRRSGRSALMFACCGGHIECVQLLLEYGADIDQINDFLPNNDDDGLLSASDHGYIESNRVGNTALACAVKNKHYNCVKLLLEKGANPNITDTVGNSILMHSCKDGDVEYTRILLQFQANANFINVESGDSSLLCAVVKENIECVHVLLQYGANATTIAYYSDGVALQTLVVSASGTGKVVQTGYESDINGTPLSIQKIEIQAKNGKMT
jgi:ankyrin repeat protein